MDTEVRMQAVLSRLWEIQQDGRLTNQALADRLGVDRALVSRARSGPAKTVGTKFLLGACRAFPELCFVLFPDMCILTEHVNVVQDEGAA